MMTIDEFLDQLKLSGVKTEQEILETKKLLPKNIKSADALKRFVKTGYLTAYQVEQVLRRQGASLVLGNYVILDKIGQGGMGTVLKAEHRLMKRTVALKLLSLKVGDSPEAIQRFKKEVKAAARLEHPNIVTAYDADESAGSFFMVMQYVQGSDLAELVRKKGPLSLEKTVNCMTQAAKGLQYAHNQGIVHRDIKPANMMIDLDGTVRVLDMGLAQLQSNEEDGDQLTGTGIVMGTVDFMSPEQGENTTTVDGRSDIYSLGMTLWFLMTGQVAYPQRSVVQKLMAHQKDPIPSLLEFFNAYSPTNFNKTKQEQYRELDLVYSKMVSKDIETRYHSMEQVIADLQQFCTESGASLRPMPTSSEDSLLSEFLRGLDNESDATWTSRSMHSAKTKKKKPNQAVELNSTVVFKSSDTEPQSFDMIELKAIDKPRTQVLNQSSFSRFLNVKNFYSGLVISILCLIAGISLYFKNGGRFSGAFQGPVVLENTPHSELGDNSDLEKSARKTFNKAKYSATEKITLTSGLTFDGIDDWVEVQLNNVPASDPISIECWVELPVVTQQTTSQKVYLLNWTGPHRQIDFGLTRNAVGAFYRLPEKTNFSYTNRANIKSGRHHLAAVWDNERLSFFVDGHIGTRSKEQVDSNTLSSDHKLYLGSGGRPSGARENRNLFNGRLTQIRIQNIVAYTENFYPPHLLKSTSNTIALFQLNEGEGDIIRDTSKHRLKGKIMGASWIQSHKLPK